MKRRPFLKTSAGSIALISVTGGCTGKKEEETEDSRSSGAVTSLAGMTLDELREKYCADLFDEYIPFMEKHVIDHKIGGFMCNASPDGSQISTDKRAVYEGRGIWVYSFLYNNLAHEQKYLDIAEKPAALLLKNKPEGDTMWPGKFNKEGTPIATPGFSDNSDLYIAEGFAEFARATGDEYYRSLAKEITLKCLRIFDTPDYRRNAGRLYVDADAPENPGIRIMGDWMLLLRNATRMLQYGDDPDMVKLAERCVDTIMNNYYNPVFGMITEMLNHDYTQYNNTLGQYVNFGNDFQALWHIMDEAVRLKNKKLFNTAATRFKRHIEVAWDDVYSGLFNILEHVDDNRWSLGKTHYGQVETLVGLMLIIEHTSADWACDFFTKTYWYVENKFPQKQYGFHLWILGSDRNVTFRKNATRIGNFHQPRHLMLNLMSLDRIIGSGGKK